MDTEVIYCGDNLEVLPNHVPGNSVDLVYIDPPFNSNRQYEVFWGEAVERRAFDDRYGDAMAYIDWMRPRIQQLHRVLKPTGSLYYHCDWHASHYVKGLLDQVFGANNFQNEIAWRRSYSHNDPRRYGANHDTILFYTKSRRWTWHPQYTKHDPDYLAENYRYTDPDGRRYRLGDLTAAKPGGDTSYEWRGMRPYKGRYWAYSKAKMAEMERAGRIVYRRTGMPVYKRYLDEMPGVPLQTFWADIAPVAATGNERQGFPTQKPLPLMERIVKASSNEGDIVLDAFCGCGTTLEAAALNKRRWIGIDFSPTACRVISGRLEARLGMQEGTDFQVRDLPKTEADLKRMPPFEFQNWACIAMGGIPNAVKVGDYGIDGRLYPSDVERRAGKRERGTQGSFLSEVDRWYPIQAKQKEKAGRPDIDSFETALRRDKRARGYFVAFGFSKDAEREIKRANREDGLDIRPVTVAELLEYEQTVA